MDIFVGFLIFLCSPIVMLAFILVSIYCFSTYRFILKFKIWLRNKIKNRIITVYRVFAGKNSHMLYVGRNWFKAYWIIFRFRFVYSIIVFEKERV